MPLQRCFASRLCFNCAGPETDYVAAIVPIIESAVRNGLADYDALGLGLKVGIFRAEPRGRIFALGLVCRGCLQGTMAMPEPRPQAELIARQCVASVG